MLLLRGATQIAEGIDKRVCVAFFILFQKLNVVIRFAMSRSTGIP